MLVVEKLSLTLGNRTILQDVSFQVGRGEKVGLVGVNGAGKSSLLKILAGQLPSDRGQVVIPASVGYLPQEPRTAFRPEQPALHCLLEARGLLDLARELETLVRRLAELPADSPELPGQLARYGEAQHRWEALGGYEGESLARRLLDGLGLARVDVTQPFGSLSGGQKTRLALGALLFSQPDLLVLDEPTNHLDRTAAGWLMDFLAGYAGAVLLVSHDLALLDRAIARVLHIDERTGQLEVFRGNYSGFVQQREERRATAEKQAREASRKIAQLQVTASRWRAGPRAAEARALDRRIERLRETQPNRAPAAKGPRMPTVEAPPSGQTVLEVTDIWKAYGDQIVLSGVGFALTRGQSLALIGPNGAGKTTLLKIAAGRLAADDGVVRPGHNARIGYYAQEHEALDPAATVLEEAHRSAAVAAPRWPPGDGPLRAYLGGFLFTGAKAHQRVGSLSGGERTRLALAKLFIQRANLLLLDEPTNNLDPASQEALLKALRGFGGSIVIVCHLASFMERLAPQRALILPGGELGDFDPSLVAIGEPPRRGGRRGDGHPAPNLAAAGRRGRS